MKKIVGQIVMNGMCEFGSALLDDGSQASRRENDIYIRIYALVHLTPSSRLASARISMLDQLKQPATFLLITSDDKSHQELGLIISDVVMEARVNARSFKIATAESQRSKIVKIRGTGVWANRGRHSPLRHQPHLPSLAYPFS